MLIEQNKQLENCYINFMKNSKDVLTLIEMSELIGISTKTASRLIQNNSIHAVKIGRSYKIPKTSVIDFLHKRK